MNISIYLDKPLYQRLKRTADGRRLSVSRCIRQILERNMVPELPAKSLKELAGIGARLGGDALKDTESIYE